MSKRFVRTETVEAEEMTRYSSAGKETFWILKTQRAGMKLEEIIPDEEFRKQYVPLEDDGARETEPGPLAWRNYTPPVRCQERLTQKLRQLPKELRDRGSSGQRICVFFSQPMRGKDSALLRRERSDAILTIRRVLSPRAEELDSLLPDASLYKPLSNLGRAINVMADADLAVFLPGWEEARGCRIENRCAEAYGIPTVEL